MKQQQLTLHADQADSSVTISSWSAVSCFILLDVLIFFIISFPSFGASFLLNCTMITVYKSVFKWLYHLYMLFNVLYWTKY